MFFGETSIQIITNYQGSQKLEAANGQLLMVTISIPIKNLDFNS